MNVLIIPTWYSDCGAENITAGIFHYEQAQSLKDLCNVAIYFPFDTKIEKNFVVNEEKGIKTYRSRIRNNKILRLLGWIIDFYRIKKEFKPDIINAHVASSAGFLSSIFYLLFRVPFIITEHNPLEFMHLENKKEYLKNKISYQLSFKNICVSSDLKAKLELYFKNIDFEVVYNGIFNPNNYEFEERYKVENKINCCIVGSFYNKDVKGYQYLLPAIKNLSDDGYEIILHICGDGEYLNYYKDYVMVNSLNSNCFFYGNCDKTKVYSIIKQMDFCISSSIFESAGVFVEEALLLGKPMVVTKSGGANSLVNENCAIVVESRSSIAIENGIKLMIENLSTFNPTYIKNYAEENFEISKISKKYLQIYNSIVNRSD